MHRCATTPAEGTKHICPRRRGHRLVVTLVGTGQMIRRARRLRVMCMHPHQEIPNGSRLFEPQPPTFLAPHHLHFEHQFRRFLHRSRAWKAFGCAERKAPPDCPRIGLSLDEESPGSGDSSTPVAYERDASTPFNRRSKQCLASRALQDRLQSDPRAVALVPEDPPKDRVFP